MKMKEFRIKKYGKYAAGLLLISATGLQAATLDSTNSILTNVANVTDFGANGVTSISFDATNDQGVLFAMNPSAFPFESINFSVTNHTGAAIDTVRVNITKDSGTFTAPPITSWESSLTSTNIPKNKVKLGDPNFTVDVTGAATQSVNAVLPLDNPLQNLDTLAFGLTIFDLNSPASTWKFHIDFNEANSIQPAAVPLPAAVWLFGSVLLGGLGFSLKGRKELTDR